MLNIQSESLSNQKTRIGEDTLEAIITNEYINFRLENSMVDILVHQNKIRLGVSRYNMEQSLKINNYPWI